LSLDNLVGVSLERIRPDSASVARLMAAARRNISDACVDTISLENRFDVAYKAIMQMANAALLANGYRALSSMPGHHMTMIQTLGMTIGFEREKLIVLDALRKQRNIVDYSGDLVPESSVNACITHAESLRDAVEGWLDRNGPDAT
jgi:hypothetical protein